MKKITFLFAALLMSSALFAQTPVIERPDDGTAAIIATQGNDGTGVFIGDQFELTGDTPIGAFQIFGTNSNGGDITPFLTGLNIFVYEDVAGLPAGDPTLPGTGLIELSDIDLANVIVNNDGATSDFTVNMTDANGGTEIMLPAGTYWLVGFPSVSSPPADGAAGRWNWRTGAGTPTVQPVLIDPFDLFGAGATNWTNISGLIGANATSMNWTLFDDAILSVSDNIIEGLSISPNPTNGIVNISLPGNKQLSNVVVYDVAGREVINNNDASNTIDLSSYTSGIYIAQLTTVDGSTQAVRIVRQ